MALPPEDLTPEKMMAASRTPTSRRWRRSAHGSTRSSRTPTAGAEAVVPPALQAAVLPRRVPAGVQRARARTWSTPTARASSASPRRASSSPAVEYEVDCIVYASGFEVGTEFTRRAGYDPSGATVCGCRSTGGGMRTLHGIHVHGFPNLFIVQPTQGANLISNVPHNLMESGAHDRRRRAPRARRRRRRSRGDRAGRGRLGRAAADRPADAVG